MQAENWPRLLWRIWWRFPKRAPVKFEAQVLVRHQGEQLSVCAQLKSATRVSMSRFQLEKYVHLPY